MANERRQIRQALQNGGVPDEQVGTLADEIITIFNRTRPLPVDWQLAQGMPITTLPKAELEDRIEAVICELEAGLQFNLTRSPDMQTVAKRILKDGRPVAVFVAWVHRDEKSRAYSFLYARRPENIWQDWPQAFASEKQVIRADGGGQYV